ncbi:hypothetical protein JW905_13110 [bacterium]|nr:hypothetical protein [candidate division CSSED10-310 bacterium]
MEIVNGVIYVMDVMDMTSHVIAGYRLESSGIPVDSPTAPSILESPSTTPSFYTEALGYGANDHFWLATWNMSSIIEIGGGGLAQPSPSPTPTTSPTLTPTMSPTMTPSQIPTLTPTQSPTWTASPTLTITITPTVTVTPTIPPVPALHTGGTAILLLAAGLLLFLDLRSRSTLES